MEVDSNPVVPEERMDEDPDSPTMDTDMDVDDFHAKAVLLDNLKHEDMQHRLTSIRQLQDIAILLGPERTREELIPFLSEYDDDEDEILLALAKVLGQLCTAVGGPEYVDCLCVPLVNLSTFEEKAVREQAILSLCALADELPKQPAQDKFLQILKKMSESEWVTSKISALGLYTTIYKDASPEQQKELQGIFSRLAQNESPKVRKAAVESLFDFASHMSSTDVVDIGMPLFEALAKDEQDSVRALAVSDLVLFAKLLPSTEQRERLLPIFSKLASDDSWQIRRVIAMKYVEVSEAFEISKAYDHATVQERFVVPFKSLVYDPEENVRTAAAGQISGFAKLVDHTTVMETLLPCVQRLLVDEGQDNKDARKALAKIVSDLAPLLGKEIATEHLLPTFRRLLEDKDPDVGLEVISNLDEIKVIGISSLSQSLLDAIKGLLVGNPWRIRFKVIERIPAVAELLGVEFFNNELFALYMSGLVDSTAEVRETTAIHLKDLATIFGATWTKEKLLPAIRRIASEEENYIYRKTQVFALKAIADVLSAEDIEKHILPAVIELSNDRVENVRLNVAKTLGTLAAPLAKSSHAKFIESTVKPALVKLSQDPDRDVRFNAEEALRQISA